MRYAILGAWVCLAGVAWAQSMPAAASSTEQAMVLECLDHSAQSLVNSPANTPGRAGRLVTLVKYAYRLDNSDPVTQALMSDILEIQGDLKAASELAARRLTAQKDNYALGLSYLRLALGALPTAKQRLDFLNTAASDSKLTPYIRAEACSQAAQILIGQDQPKAANEKVQQALKLDPNLAAALAASLSLKDNPTPLDQAKTALAIVQADPNDTGTAWQLAVLLDSNGLYEQAVVFYDYAWQLTLRADREGVTEPMAVQYVNGLLDAGQFRKAVEAVVPLRKKLGDTPEVKSLLMEAYRASGDLDRANALMEELQSQLAEAESLQNKSPEAYKTTAWYFLINDYRPNSALSYARNAAKSLDQKTDQMNLVLWAAELKAGNAPAGETGLKALLDKDIYAAWFLAQYYYNNNKADDGKKAILAGLKLSQRGRAFRALAALAKRQNVTFEPPPAARDIAAALAQFDRRCLALGSSPEQFFSIKLAPIRDEFTAGETVQVEATLTNDSEVDIPTGPAGLFSPAMSLTAHLDNGQDFENLPMVIFPAQRYLKAGENLHATASLNVGAFQEWLAHHPLDNVQVTVSSTLDPVQKNGTTTSVLPTFHVAPCIFKCRDVLIDFDPQKDDWEKVYQLTLGYVVKDLKQGDLRERLTAARKIAFLLTLVGDADVGRGNVPTKLLGVVKQPVLLSMMRATLQDASPAVRAQMVAALHYCRLDTNLLRLLKPAYDDKSELVRLHLAELLGVADLLKDPTIAARFAADSDPSVRQMAAVFAQK